MNKIQLWLTELTSHMFRPHMNSQKKTTSPSQENLSPQHHSQCNKYGHFQDIDLFVYPQKAVCKPLKGYIYNRTTNKLNTRQINYSLFLTNVVKTSQPCIWYVTFASRDFRGGIRQTLVCFILKCFFSQCWNRQFFLSNICAWYQCIIFTENIAIW